MRKPVSDQTSIDVNYSKMTLAITIALSKESVTAHSIFLLNLDLYATLYRLFTVCLRLLLQFLIFCAIIFHVKLQAYINDSYLNMHFLITHVKNPHTDRLGKSS